MTFDVTVNGRDYRVDLEQQEGRAWACRVNGQEIFVNVADAATGMLSLLIGNESHQVFVNSAHQQVTIGGVRFAVDVRDPRSWSTRQSKAHSQVGSKKVVAPMPGKVVRVIAAPGAEVEQGAGVIVIEAMKMQNELKSPKKGRVGKILASEGAAVNAGDVLAVID